MRWLAGVGIPYLALIVLAVIEGGGGWDTFARKILELGIDLCILGIGVCGALFATQQGNGKTPDPPVGVAVSVVLVTILITGFCLNLRKSEGAGERTRATISLFLGIVILGINTLIVMRYI